MDERYKGGNYPTSHLVSDSLVKSWQSFGRASAFDFDIIDGVAVFRSYADTAAFNYAYAAKDINTNTLSHIVKHFGTLPFCWIVDDAQRLLKEKGFSLEETWKGMTIDLSKLQNISTPDVESVLADNELRLNHWMEIVAKGFEVSKSSVETFAKPLAKLDDQRFFVAYVEGVPASACLVTLCRPTAFLAYVTTIPEKRRHGAGRALSAFSLVDARQQGCVNAALQSSQMGEKVYRSLGFEEANSYQLWGRKNDG